jgi:hemerythrin-like domain-containing protein
MDPIAAWHADHVRFGRLLELLEHELARFHDGGTPDYERMREVVRWLRDYSDTAHHPREDVAFERLAQRDPSLALPVSRLLQEHRVIMHSGENLLELLDAVAAGSFVPRVELEAAAATYLVYYRNHLATEEQRILPRAGGLLDAADWAAVAAAVPEDAERSARALRAEAALGL